MFNKKFFDKGTDSRQFFGGCGSFGELKGELTRDGQTVTLTAADYKMTCAYTSDAYGVFNRQDTFINTSDKPMQVNALKSRFVFDGGEYQVYTQFNNWQTENAGYWQYLVNNITIGSESVRTCQNAAPFLVLWSDQANRGTAFHLLPSSNWEIKVSRAGIVGKKTRIVVELGISDYNFNLTVAPGESVKLPELLCYEVFDKLSLDCYKLHNYMHTNYPRKELPIIYNTWMYKFDHITYENISKQIPLAADMGCEYFFLDAGWFGKGADWSSSVGDWSENMVTRLAGRMMDIANEVRAAGMKFGLWLEPERANVNSDAMKEHPEFYLPITGDEGNYLLDFANPDAVDWMLDVIFKLIDKYGIRYIKDDFNVNSFFSEKQDAFLAYHAGHEDFMRRLQARYPDLYLCSCASGGMRMELQNYKFFNSSWPSDNESPYTEMDMYRHAILRLPPQAMERWTAIHSIENQHEFYASFAGCNKGNTERLVACCDATWCHIEGIQVSYLKGYMSCGPIGFSCDLSLVSEKVRAELKAFVAQVKENRDFWKTAVARVLCDTKTMTIYQYSDMALNKAVLQLFPTDTTQEVGTVYPQLDAAKTYRVNGELFSGAQLMAEGIEVTLHTDWDDHYPMFEVTLEAVN